PIGDDAVRLTVLLHDHHADVLAAHLPRSIQHCGGRRHLDGPLVVDEVANLCHFSCSPSSVPSRRLAARGAASQKRYEGVQSTCLCSTARWLSWAGPTLARPAAHLGAPGARAWPAAGLSHLSARCET